ncbi:MAG: ATP-grasp domain-containing protein [Planctomycetaceae bacterium]
MPFTEPISPGRKRRVLIVGGSTRAAASSARRAGLQPICADLFADHDLRQIAEVVTVRNFPDSLPEDVAHAQADGWFYTGALENRPDLIQRMDRPDASYGPLWGTNAAALRLIRDPFRVASTLRQNGHPTLEVAGQASAPPANGTWMLKPLASAGGRAVCLWEESRRSQGIHEPVYFQQFCHGETLSAVFRCESTGITLLGMSRQLPGHQLSNATAPFLYSGALGPLPCDAPGDLYFEQGQQVKRQLQSLADVCELRGIVGVDFIKDDNGTPWLLEVNPRYTASVEILELAKQESFLKKPDNEPASRHSNESPVVMKLILYAPQTVVIGDLTHHAVGDDWTVPHIADIPSPGSQIPSGWPICTVFAFGTTEAECTARLKRRVDTVWKMVNYRGNEPDERFQE